LCTVQKNAYMDTETMMLWLERIYRPWAVTINGPHIMILDTFAAHKTKVVVDYITDYQGHLILIPGGYTSKLQVLDVGINKPFKDYLRDKYDNWFMNANIRTAKPKRTDIAKWVVDTWYDDITKKMIYNAWRKVGLPITKLGNIELDVSMYDSDDAYDEEAGQLFFEEDGLIVLRNICEFSQQSDFLEIKKTSSETENDDEITFPSDQEQQLEKNECETENEDETESPFY
jgi:DDE superfamily endonuclease